MPIILHHCICYSLYYLCLLTFRYYYSLLLVTLSFSFDSFYTLNIFLSTCLNLQCLAVCIRVLPSVFIYQ